MPLDEEARVRVRDTARWLCGFTIDDLAERLPDLDRQTIREAVRDFEHRGWCKVQRVGRRRRYAWCRPRNTGPRSRPRQKPPEALVTDRRAGGLPIAGTGRPERPTDREVADLLEEVTRAGGEIEKRKRHWLVRYGGQPITTVPNTPSDYRSLLNARATLRRAGLPLGEGLYSSQQPEPTEGGHP